MNTLILQEATPPEDLASDSFTSLLTANTGVNMIKHRLVLVVACLPLLSGCMATQYLQHQPGVRQKRVNEFRQAVQFKRKIMLEYDATLRNVSSEKDIGDVRYTASISLSRRQEDGKYPIRIRKKPLPNSAALGTQIPIIPDHSRLEFLSSTNYAVINPQGDDFYLMLRSEASSETPEILLYNECGGRYDTWWRSILLIPAVPAAIVFDVVTSPLQFVMLIGKALSGLSLAG